MSMARVSAAERGAVVLLSPLSSEMRSQGACLAIFRSRAGLCIEGCAHLRVLAGAVRVHGYTITPSNVYHSLVSPTNSGRIVITAVDRKLQEGKPYGTIVFASSVDQQSGSILLDLPLDEIKRMNMLMKTHLWLNDTTCLAILKQSNSLLVQSLQLHPKTKLMFSGVEGTVFSDHFFIKLFQQADATRRGISFPLIYSNVADDIRDAQVPNPVVLMCGNQNSGKSTFCQFLMNHLLNSKRSVAYLECDVGQCEFTLPGIVSLFCINEPVFGPPCAHLRRPEKAYFFGDNSPKQEPDYLIFLIKQCLDYYWKEVASKQHRTVLIVNQCGWVTDLGLPVLIDIIRTVSPSHMIQLVLDTHQQIFDQSFLDSEPGWRTRAKNVPNPKPLVQDLAWFSSMRMDYHRARSDSPVLLSEELDEQPPEDDDLNKEESEEGPPKKKHKEGDLLLPGGRSQLSEEVMTQCQWKSMGPNCSLCVIQVDRMNVRVLFKNSFRCRLMNYVAYFSPLLGTLSSDIHTERLHNFLLAATPYEVPWHHVAVHSLLVNVPFSQMLYAINGKFVALVRVPEDEIEESSSQHPEVMKSVKSRYPQGEFIGLGLVRGIDSERKVICITTPESKKWLIKVNCLMLGNLEDPSELVHHTHNISHHHFSS